MKINGMLEKYKVSGGNIFCEHHEIYKAAEIMHKRQ